MLNKLLLIGLLISPVIWAQDASEEAIILNQELQFLEEAANAVTILSASQGTSVEGGAQATGTSSLEQEYFGSELNDEVTTQTAGPKRRR